jgi:hypothetical protein
LPPAARSSGAMTGWKTHCAGTPRARCSAADARLHSGMRFLGRNGGADSLDRQADVVFRE